MNGNGCAPLLRPPAGPSLRCRTYSAAPTSQLRYCTHLHIPLLYLYPPPTSYSAAVPTSLLGYSAAAPPTQLRYSATAHHPATLRCCTHLQATLRCTHLQVTLLYPYPTSLFRCCAHLPARSLRCCAHYHLRYKTPLLYPPPSYTTPQHSPCVMYASLFEIDKGVRYPLHLPAALRNPPPSYVTVLFPPRSYTLMRQPPPRYRHLVVHTPLHILRCTYSLFSGTRPSPRSTSVRDTMHLDQSIGGAVQP